MLRVKVKNRVFGLFVRKLIFMNFVICIFFGTIDTKVVSRRIAGWAIWHRDRIGQHAALYNKTGPSSFYRPAVVGYSHCAQLYSDYRVSVIGKEGKGTMIEKKHNVYSYFACVQAHAQASKTIKKKLVSKYTNLYYVRVIYTYYTSKYNFVIFFLLLFSCLIEM